MTSKIRQRLASEGGFTLIELLIVLVIIGILLAIAVPSYLGFRERAADRTAAANLRAAIPSAEAFYNDQVPVSTYGGMTVAGLQAIDSGLSSTVSVEAAGAASYCLESTVNGQTWSVTGPGGTPVEAAC